MTGTNPIIQNLLEANPLREPTLRSIIRELELPRGSHGLDAGCGIGLQALLLAEAIGPDGKVYALDLMPELLSYGKELVSKAGFGDRITFHAGDVNCLPFESNSFDWAWSADCIGYPAGDLMPSLQELMRVVKPGGSVILLGWSSQQLLPGYPLLEARLNATCSAYNPFLNGKSPESNFMRALGSFQRMDLNEIEAKTFVGNIQAPLNSGERVALMSLFKMLWGEPQPEVSAEDWAEYTRLCTPGFPDFILDIPDYYAFFTYSVFRGNVPEE
ncbi:MAG TPA: class I SAM-dependent methyltransferase [Anaerolineales bacterium]|nr:class I SAM-dependent methyltransferase [Anaerolineales bacterium]